MENLMIAPTLSRFACLRQAARIAAAAACITFVHIWDVTASPSADAAPIQYQRAQRLAFEPNRGQTDDQVRFLARGKDYTVFLTPTEAVLAPRSRARGGATEHETVRMRLVGA